MINGIGQNNTVNFQRNLKPLSEYKGPILKLTPKDKEEIARLQKSIGIYECEIYDLKKRLKTHMLQRAIEYYWSRIDMCENMIEELLDRIKEIKVSRFNKQKSKLG